MLWLWRRPVAAAPIGPLAWEPPYATGSGPRKGKKDRKKKKKRIGFQGQGETDAYTDSFLRGRKAPFNVGRW